MMKKAHGFTLIELMIAITILGIVIALALPNFRQLMQNNRGSTQANDLVAMIALAKSEALGRGRQVEIRADSGDWSDGWVMRADIDRNGIFTDAADVELLQSDPYSQSTLTHANGDTAIVVQANGLVAGGAFSFSLVADDCYGENNRTVNVTATGTVRITKNPC